MRLEQTRDTTREGTRENIRSIQDTQQKLQFTAEAKDLLEQQPQDQSDGLRNDPDDGFRTGHDGRRIDQKKVADEEPPIQALLGNSYDEEYDDGEHECAGASLRWKAEVPAEDVSRSPRGVLHQDQEDSCDSSQCTITDEKEEERHLPFLGMVRWLWPTQPFSPALRSLQHFSHRLQVRLALKF